MKVEILRGISGSGKSTVARKLVANVNSSIICSADDYFVTLVGKYEFDARQLSAAHGYCKGKYAAALELGVELVVVDNTNTQKWEFENYVHQAHAAGYEVNVQVVGDPKDWESIKGRNIHGVPDEVLKRQSERFEF